MTDRPPSPTSPARPRWFGLAALLGAIAGATLFPRPAQGRPGAQTPPRR